MLVAAWKTDSICEFTWLLTLPRPTDKAGSLLVPKGNIPSRKRMEGSKNYLSATNTITVTCRGRIHSPRPFSKVGFRRVCPVSLLVRERQSFCKRENLEGVSFRSQYPSVSLDSAAGQNEGHQPSRDLFSRSDKSQSLSQAVTASLRCVSAFTGQLQKGGEN